jgi:DNA-binding NarL/FixJ family response regulator
MISVLLADDQQLIRTGLRLIVDAETDVEVVGEAANGREAVDLARRLSPEIILMDIRMPDMDGIAATAEIVRLNIATRIIMVTTFDPDEYLYDALLAGASGFLLKDTPADDLVSAIRTVAGGDSVLSPRVTRQLIEQFNKQSPITRPTRSIDHLTDREREVLLLMGRGLANGEIAEALFVSETTVKTHVSHVLAKLGLRDRVQAVVFAYENRLVIPGAK